ncbi:hypothetical protein Bca52824_091535 [Brassica carinata]|uniref:Uncharacterized protein n=1 Tax=Brassica carinata TaxID=52824 RepID=A0A8X7NUV4_BRACI|nr:hypothetical protein Bca52824_091535 [Brassica carinata]
MEDIGNFVSIICVDEARIEGILDEVDHTNGRFVVKNGKIFTCLLFMVYAFHISFLLCSSLQRSYLVFLLVQQETLEVKEESLVDLRSRHHSTSMDL